MGVVKNLMVRVGSDVSSYVKGMREASVSNMAFGKSSKETQTAAKGYESPFKAAARASAAFKQEMAAVGKANDSAKERLASVSQELGKAKSALQAVQAASAGLNMKKTFAEERAGIEAEIEAVNAKLGSLQQGMKGSKNGIVAFGDDFLSMDDAKAQYASLTSESDALGQKLAALDEVAGHLGSSFQTSTIKEALKEVHAQVDKLGAEYRATEGDMARTAERASHLGRASPVAAAVSAALKAAGNNARGLGTRLANIPALFGKISKSAKSGSDSVTRLLQDIKRIGVVSLGLRVASGLFGKMKSMISSCMTSNAAYTESVNTMRYQLTQALAPAIGLVTSLLQKAMPVINGFASAFSRVLVAAFGKTEAAAYAASAAMASAGTYGFDQITKVDASAVSDTSVQGADMFSGVADKVAGEIGKIKAIIKNGDWSGLGKYVGSGISSIFAGIDWQQCRDMLTEGFNSILELIPGFAAGFVPLQGIDFSAAITSLQGLWQSIMDFTELAGGALATVYNSVLKPILGWVIEKTAPASVNLLTSAFGLLSSILVPVIGGIEILGRSAEPVFQWLGGFAADTLGHLKEQFDKVAKVFQEKTPEINRIFSGLGEVITSVWELIKPVLDSLKKLWGEVFDFMGDEASTVISSCIEMLAGLADFLGGVFTGDWKKAINGLIGFINGLVSGVFEGLNAVFKLLNKISITIPDYDIFGDLAGTTFGFNIQMLTAPQIPYLAEGGYVVAPTEARIGEGGYKEAVLPLERNTGWAKTVAALIDGERDSGGLGTTTIQVFIGGKKVHEETIDYINSKTRATGVCPIRV